MSTTSSDEQHRLQKMINGQNGMSYQDAVDEEVDNGLDEGAEIIELNFKGEKLESIYNNGSPMNTTDQSNCLKLDGRSKMNQKEKKGRYGIGGTFSRCRLAGQGKQIITSRDGEILFQAVIDLHYLAFECEDEQCWTGEHEKKPRFEKVTEGYDKYKGGVTKEYIGDNLEQEFNLNNVVKHIATKYNNQIKGKVLQ